MPEICGERAQRLQDRDEWPVEWCPKHCCGSVNTFPERNESNGYQERCYRGWEFDEDCELVIVEVVIVNSDD